MAKPLALRGVQLRHPRIRRERVQPPIQQLQPLQRHPRIRELVNRPQRPRLRLRDQLPGRRPPLGRMLLDQPQRVTRGRIDRRLQHGHPITCLRDLRIDTLNRGPRRLLRRAPQRIRTSRKQRRLRLLVRPLQRRYTTMSDAQLLDQPGQLQAQLLQRLKPGHRNQHPHQSPVAIPHLQASLDSPNISRSISSLGMRTFRSPTRTVRTWPRAIIRSSVARLTRSAAAASSFRHNGDTADGSS